MTDTSNMSSRGTQTGTGGTSEYDGEQIAFAKRLETVRLRIAQACARADRKPPEVRLLSVRKTVPLSMMRTAIAAGCTVFGENHVQEAMHKANALRGLDRWSMIGHLQTNKAR